MPSKQISGGSAPVICKCHSQDPRAPVFLGHDQGMERMEHIREVRQKRFLSATPDFTLVVGDYFEKVFANDLLRESSRSREWLSHPETFRDGPIRTLTLNGPVLPIQLTKITDYLYSNDYAICIPEVLGYPAPFRGRETTCRSCNNLFRLLSLHLGIFHAAQYLGLEGLQRLAMARFAEILSYCPIPVIHMAIDDVYGIKPHVWKNQIEDVYSLAEIVDYRESLVRDLVVRIVRMRLEKIRVEIQKGRCPTEKAMADPALPFRDLGKKYPDLAGHLRAWFIREFSQKTAGSC